MKLQPAIIFVLCLAVLIDNIQAQSDLNSQQIKQEAPYGKWLDSRQSKEQILTRYYICGAELNYLKMTTSYDCSLRKQAGNQPFFFNCMGGQTMWERSNGIKFRYCNFQNWDDQKVQLYYGTWEWLGMAQCPRNQYVYGYRAKVNDVNGLTGLSLLCRNYYKSESSEVLVKDGKGNWTELIATSKSFAYDFQIKMTEVKASEHLTGLSLLFRPYPQIIKLQFNYDTIPLPDILMEQRPRQFFKNENKTSEATVKFDLNPIINDMINQRIRTAQPTGYRSSHYNPYINQIAVRKPFLQYALRNSKNKYYNQSLSKWLKPNFDLKALFPTIISKMEAKQLDVDRKLAYKQKTFPQNFVFGKVFPLTIPPYSIMSYSIPPCMRMELRIRVYTTTISNPYTLSITYGTGNQQDIENISGVFQGTIYGRPEIQTDYYPIC